MRRLLAVLAVAAGVLGLLSSPAAASHNAGAYGMCNLIASSQTTGVYTATQGAIGVVMEHDGSYGPASPNYDVKLQPGGCVRSPSGVWLGYGSIVDVFNHNRVWIQRLQGTNPSGLYHWMNNGAASYNYKVVQP